MDFADGDRDIIGRGLVAYNLQQVPMTQRELFISIDKKVVDENGTILAGCCGEVYCWNVACIDMLWVDERHRGRGLGARLLAEVEQAAMEENCSLIHLDTFDFQAKDFYLRHGYEVFGALEDCPEGHCRYYLKKKLRRSREMEYITLGKTGLKVSRLGFGGIPIQRLDAAAAKTLLNAVEAAGVNFIDSARGYTVSEELIGQAIEGRRDRFILATKSMARDKEGMAKDIETSLRNFRTDYIDLYQVHNPNLKHLEQITAPGGALEALLEAKTAGKIGHLGLTAHSAEVFGKALELDWVETVMFPYNIVETHGTELMERARAKNIGFINMKSLSGGAIEDARLALRFAAANPNVSVVLPGMYSPEEVEQNAAAVADTSPLTGGELEKVEALRQELGTSFCRRCGYCAPCTVGIDIPNHFVFHGYLSRYGLEDWARSRYAALSAHADDCVECGACEERCPYQLPIREMLKKVAADFAK